MARPLKDKEKEYGLDYLVFAKDPVLFAVGHKTGISDLAARQLAAGHNWLKVPDIEARLAARSRGRKPSVTVRLLERLAVMQPKSRLIWIMGADNLASFHLWYQARRIPRLADILVLNRPGYGAAALSGIMKRQNAWRILDAAVAVVMLGLAFGMARAGGWL